MIKRTNLSAIRLMDFFQVMSLVNDYVKNEDLQELKLETAYQNFKISFQEFDKALKQSKTSVTTKEVTKADDLRSKTITAFMTILRGFSNSPNQEQAKKSEKLLSEINKYGKNISEMPLREKSAVITNLVQDFGEAPNSQFLTDLHLSEWVELLEKQNNDFDTLYKLRSEQQSAVEVGKVKNTRTSLQKEFDFLAKTINANVFLNGDTPYKKLVDKINQEVSRSISEAKARSSRKENSVTKADNSIK